MIRAQLADRTISIEFLHARFGMATQRACPSVAVDLSSPCAARRAEAAPVTTMLRGAVRLGPSRSGEVPPLADN
jgi:hypothetical protein